MVGGVIDSAASTLDKSPLDFAKANAPAETNERANAPAKATKKQSPVPPKTTVKAPSIASILNDRLQGWSVSFQNELKRIGFVYAHSFKRSYFQRRAAYLQRIYPRRPFGFTKTVIPKAWKIATKELNRIQTPVDVPYVKPVLRRFNGFIVDKSARIVFRRQCNKTSGNHSRSSVTLTPILYFRQIPDFVLAQAWNTVCGGNYPPDGNNGVHWALERVGFRRPKPEELCEEHKELNVAQL